jgi:hypothetical protein
VLAAITGWFLFRGDGGDAINHGDDFCRTVGTALTAAGTTGGIDDEVQHDVLLGICFP